MTEPKQNSPARLPRLFDFGAEQHIDASLEAGPEPPRARRSVCQTHETKPRRGRQMRDQLGRSRDHQVRPPGSKRRHRLESPQQQPAMLPRRRLSPNKLRAANNKVYFGARFPKKGRAFECRLTGANNGHRSAGETGKLRMLAGMRNQWRATLTGWNAQCGGM